MRHIIVGAVVAVQLLVSSATAQPLADRIPNDALVYVGWRGINSMGPDFERSHFKAVLEATGPEDLFEQFIPQLIERLSEEDRQMADRVQFVAEAARLMWRHPTAFYFGGFELTGEAGLSPRIGLICQAGADARPVKVRLEELAEQIGATELMSVAQHGDRLVLTLGNATLSAKLANDPGAGASLAEDAALKSALTQVHEDPAAIVYVNVQGLLDEARAHVQGMFDEARQVLPQDNSMAAAVLLHVSLVIGLESVPHAIWTAGFEGRNWGQRLFVAAPQPRAGLVALMVSDPVTDEIFRVVPMTAATANVARADLSASLGQILAVLERGNLLRPSSIKWGKQELTKKLGFDPDSEFLAVLGPEWAAYTDRDVAGTGVLGTVVVNRPRDPEAVGRALVSIAEFATSIVIPQFQENEDVTITVRQTRADGMTIHYLATPAVSPAWGIKDGYLYMGLYPQVVAAGAGFVDSGAPSLLQNPHFRDVRRRLGNVRPNSIAFADLSQTVRDGYQAAMIIVRMYTGLADVYGMSSPPMLVPPLSKLLPHVSPSGRVTWVDEQGYHARSISPFPGIVPAVTEIDLAAAQTAVMLTAAPILLPAFAAARKTARETMAAMQVRGIHQGCHFYAEVNDGRFPDDIGTLLLRQYFVVEYTLSPTSRKTAPPGFDSWPDEDRRRWVNANSSYVLVPGLRNDNDSETIAVFTKLQDSDGEVIPICWNDNHVTLEPIARAKQLILEQTGKSLEQWSGLPRPTETSR